MSLMIRVRQSLAHCLDYLLPAACLLCGRRLTDGETALALCSACWPEQPPSAPAACPRCAQPFPDACNGDHHCEPCLRQPPPFQKVYTLGLYRDHLQQAIQSFKYRNNLLLVQPLAAQLAARLVFEPGAHPEVLVPVPLHPTRLRRRSYNQALLLARALSRRLELPTAHLLARTRATQTQQGLSAAERRQNLAGAFKLTAEVRDKRVLLVDDVMTTGATIRECAQTLHRGGAAEIRVAVLARA